MKNSIENRINFLLFLKPICVDVTCVCRCACVSAKMVSVSGMSVSDSTHFRGAPVSRAHHLPPSDVYTSERLHIAGAVSSSHWGRWCTGVRSGYTTTREWGMEWHWIEAWKLVLAWYNIANFTRKYWISLLH